MVTARARMGCPTSPPSTLPRSPCGKGPVTSILDAWHRKVLGILTVPNTGFDLTSLSSVWVFPYPPPCQVSSYPKLPTSRWGGGGLNIWLGQVRAEIPHRTFKQPHAPPKPPGLLLQDSGLAALALGYLIFTGFLLPSLRITLIHYCLLSHSLWPRGFIPSYAFTFVLGKGLKINSCTSHDWCIVF